MPLSTFASTIRSVVTLQSKIASNPDLGVKGLTSVDCLALCLIEDEKKPTRNELRRRLSLRKPQLDRLISNLEKRGLIQASDDTIALSPSGVQVHTQLESKWDLWLKNNPDHKAALASIRTGARTMQTGLAAS